MKENEIKNLMAEMGLTKYELMQSLCDLTGITVRNAVVGDGWVYKLSNGRFFGTQDRVIGYLLSIKK